MWVIFKKEITSFFSSIIGYIAIVVFLVAMGLFLWVFPDTNILDYGYATLDQLFEFAPWVLMFLIPAICMRSFAEEFKTGTIELLATHPLSDFQIILGKYFASLVLLFFALVPTLFYYVTIFLLSVPVGNVDTGAIIGSYIGLFLLGAAFVAIGLFTSSLTENQIVAFILGMFFCFVFYMGFNFISEFEVFYGEMAYWLKQVGIRAHYKSISRGVIDTRDVIYFLSLGGIFIYGTKTVLESRKW